MLKNFRRNPGMGNVSQKKYIGPYKILAYKGKGNYLLLNEELNKTVGPSNQTNFKPWISHESETDKNKVEDDNIVNNSNEDLNDSIFKTQDKFIEENECHEEDDPISIIELPMPDKDEQVEDINAEQENCCSQENQKKI